MVTSAMLGITFTGFLILLVGQGIYNLYRNLEDEPATATPWSPPARAWGSEGMDGSISPERAKESLRGGSPPPAPHHQPKDPEYLAENTELLREIEAQETKLESTEILWINRIKKYVTANLIVDGGAPVEEIANVLHELDKLIQNERKKFYVERTFNEIIRRIEQGTKVQFNFRYVDLQKEEAKEIDAIRREIKKTETPNQRVESLLVQARNILADWKNKGGLIDISKQHLVIQHLDDAIEAKKDVLALLLAARRLTSKVNEIIEKNKEHN